MVNADQRRRMKEGLRRRMRDLAVKRQCPSCERKSAIQRSSLPGLPTILVCRYCGYERALET